MKRKCNAIIFTFIVVLMLFVAGGDKIDTQAATTTNINWGETYPGTITNSNDLFEYRLKLPSAGRVRFTITLSNLESAKVYINNASGERVWGTEYPVDGTTSYDIDLKSGSYTFYVEQRSSNTGVFRFTATFTSAGESFAESNNTRTNASRPSFGKQVNGHLAYNDEIDIYRYDLNSSGRLTLTLNSTLESVRLFIEDASGEKVWGTNYPKEGTTTYTIDLVKGTYYLNLERYSKSNNYVGNYNYLVSFVSAGESFAEPNDSPTKAATPALGATVRGQLAANDETDVYKYTFSYARKLTLRFDCSMDGSVIYMTDASGDRIWGNEYPEEGTVSYDIDVSAGTYYFYVERNYLNKTGNYSFVLSNYVAPQQPVNRPDSDNQPSTSTSFQPKKTQISDVESKKGRKIVVVWKAKPGVSGYQIQCSLKKNFKKNTKTYTVKGRTKTSKTIKKLKAKKKYFVRVRSFKKSKVNGKTVKVFSKWSKVKKVKVRK